MHIGHVVKLQRREGGDPWPLPRHGPVVPEVTPEMVGTVIRGGQRDDPAVRAAVDGKVRLFRVSRHSAEVVREAGKPLSKVWGVEES